jgi:hypothetical protein
MYPGGAADGTRLRHPGLPAAGARHRAGSHQRPVGAVEVQFNVPATDCRRDSRLKADRAGGKINNRLYGLLCFWGGFE